MDLMRGFNHLEYYEQMDSHCLCYAACSAINLPVLLATLCRSCAILMRKEGITILLCESPSAKSSFIEEDTQSRRAATFKFRSDSRRLQLVNPCTFSSCSLRHASTEVLLVGASGKFSCGAPRSQCERRSAKAWGVSRSPHE
jgi:hypothetical protein